MDSLNPISSGNVTQKNTSSQPEKTSVSASDATPSKSALPDVQVELSGQLSSAESEAIMRAAKVKEMREAIIEGRFPLDARKIAENFAELEKLL